LKFFFFSFLKKKKKKLKKKIQGEWNFEFISEIKDLTFQYPKCSNWDSFGFLELGVLLKFDSSISIKRKN